MRLFAPLNPPIASFAGRRIWLVGASTGIGAATAELLLAQGAIVAVSARSADKLQASFGDRAVVLPLDATDAAATHAAAQQLRALWGRIDLVLAVAGTYKEMRASELNLPEAQRIVEVNLAATLNVFAAVQPVLTEQRAGGFAIVASVAGYGGLPNSVAYGASKAACINLAESLYLDLRKFGIAVYLITPGFVDTPLTANNAFPMPFIVSAGEAASSIVAGLARGDFEIHFPRTFTRILKILNLLPYRLYFWCVRRFTGL